MFVQCLVRLDRLSEVHVQAVVKLQLEVRDAGRITLLFASSHEKPEASRLHEPSNVLDPCVQPIEFMLLQLEVEERRSHRANVCYVRHWSLVLFLCSLLCSAASGCHLTSGWPDMVFVACSAMIAAMTVVTCSWVVVLQVIDALVNVPEGTTRPKWVQAEAPRLFMAGLMCSDPALRRRFSERLIKEAATSAAAAAAVAAARAAGAVGGLGTAGAEAASPTEAAAVARGPRGVASPSAITLHALRLDWEPLQLRFWPAAVADALLGLVNGDRGLTLQEDECLRPLGAAGGGAVVTRESTPLS